MMRRGDLSVPQSSERRSERECAGPDQVRELAALLRREKGVDLPERADERLAQVLGRLDSFAGDFLHSCRVEGLSAI